MFWMPAPFAVTDGSNPRPLSSTENVTAPSCSASVTVAALACVLDDVLQRLQGAEVHGRLDFGGIAPEALRLHADRDRRSPSAGAESGFQAVGGKQRRVDAMGKLSQRQDRFVGLGAELGDYTGRLAGPFLLGQRLGQRQTDLHGDQLLLGTIVEVALEATPLVVLGTDQALSGGPQLLHVVQQLGGETDVAQHQAGLGGNVRDELVLCGRDGLASRLGHGEGAQQLAVVGDGGGPIGAGEVGKAVAAERQRSRRAVLGPLRP